MNSVELLSLNPGKRSTKELVVRTLGSKWPLSAKEIHQCLAREQDFENTYQTVHKGIHELKTERVVIKEGKKYKLSREWLENSKNYFVSLSRMYENKEFSVEKQQVFFFDNYTDYTMSLANMFHSKKLMGKEYVDLYVLSRHLFWPLKFSFQDFDLCISIGKTIKPHIISQHLTPFDLLIKKYYKVAGWPEVVVGSGIELEEDIMVHGPTIVQVKYSEKTKQIIDEIYGNVNDFTALFKQYLKNNTKDLEIEMRITKNVQLAEMMRENIKRKLGEAK